MVDINNHIEHICDQLAERNVSLFLGAGINADLINTDNESFPLGNELSHAICRDLLHDPSLSFSLDEAAEQARYRLGEQQFNNYIFGLFSSFTPGAVHSIISHLPWDAIFTTNYDTLIEEAYRNNMPISRIRPILSVNDDVSSLTDTDIPYYKLHGSVDRCNTPDGRLIITKADYRSYLKLRSKLFSRLKKDLTSRTFIFAGYSFADNNFREIFDACLEEIGTALLPRSFAIKPNVKQIEVEYWYEKYNLVLIDSTALDFLEALHSSFSSYEKTDVNDRKSTTKYQIDITASFPIHYSSYYMISPKNINGKSEPKLFYSGNSASWADIRDNVIHFRDCFWDLAETIFEEITNPVLPASIYLVHGHAGTGKSTLVNQLAFFCSKDLDSPVFIHIPGTPIDEKHLLDIVKSNPSKRIIVIVNDASFYISSIDAIKKSIDLSGIPITFLLEERTNQWNISYSAGCRFHIDGEFELESLSDSEIKGILVKLEQYDSLGMLEPISFDERVAHFKKLADRQLLVALKELTTGNRFDEIVIDEYNKLLSPKSKRAYLLASAIGQVDLYLRYETLMRIINCDWDELVDSIFKETEGILVSSEATGHSRHNFGYKLRVRHPLIAQIIFANSAVSDQEKYDILNAIVSNLDPGYAEDKRLLETIVRRKELVRVFSNIDYARSFYNRLSEILPDNAYVLQHRSILERELLNADAALKFAREAIGLCPANIAIRNTLGLALEFASREENDPTKRSLFLNEAKRIFLDAIKKEPRDAFGYLGLHYVNLNEINTLTDDEERNKKQYEALGLLEEAKDVTANPSIVESEYAKLSQKLSGSEFAIKSLLRAIDKEPRNYRLRDVAAQFLIAAGDYSLAFRIAQEGLKHAPAEWKLFRHLARCHQEIENNSAVTTQYFESAIRNNRKNYKLYVEYASFLFKNGEYTDAKSMFYESNRIAENTFEKKRVIMFWLDKGPSMSKRSFKGEVESIQGASITIRAIPEGFLSRTWKSDGINNLLKIGDHVGYNVYFNTYGANAKIMKV